MLVRRARHSAVLRLSLRLTRITHSLTGFVSITSPSARYIASLSSRLDSDAADFDFFADFAPGAFVDFEAASMARRAA